MIERSPTHQARESAHVQSAPPPVWNLGQRVFLTFAVLIAALTLALASPGVDTAPGDPTVAAPRLQLDPNTAPPEVLGALPQVGPTMVHYLIQARPVGPFTSLQDVRRRQHD